jgi:hypothetical protein
MESLLNKANDTFDSVIKTISDTFNSFDSEVRQAKYKIELDEFLKRYSLRIKKVVDSCTNVVQLDSAEKYIRNGVNAYVKNQNTLIIGEYVKVTIEPKRIELNSIKKPVEKTDNILNKIW